MDCLDAKQKLEPCARGELSPGDRAELGRHIATCEGCRLELELTRAVLGSSSAGAALDDPSLVDPVLPHPDPDKPPPLEPSIEQERLPQPPAEGPGPPRVLTSQLPEDAEDTLDLASIQPTNAYDPGAIDLPHAEPSPHFEGASQPDAPFVADEPSEEAVPFADLSVESPVTAAAASAGGVAAASGASARWDFEPVDVPRAAVPPEGSLTFAKEALDRKRGNALRGRKGARLVLWIGGAVGGVGLLGASVWMALAFRDPQIGQDPANLPAVHPPPGTEIAPPAPTDSMAPDAEAVRGMTAADSVPSPQPPALAPMKAGAAGTSAIAPEIASPKVPPAKPSPAKATDPVRGSGAPSAPTTAKATDGVSAGKPAASPAPPAFRADELAPAPRREPQILTVEPDAPPGSEPVDEPEPPTSEAAKPSKPVSSAPIFVPPGSVTKSAGGATAKQPAQDSASSGPIGRLHLATVTAEKSGDLDALRKLKTSWKSMIRSTTGAERARAKREYADCLWAIQEITSRDADRKEALAAYRDYVLYAPAGGADARTVSRMRHLEDILSDPR